jgi:hypothetical protein
MLIRENRDGEHEEREAEPDDEAEADWEGGHILSRLRRITETTTP